MWIPVFAVFSESADLYFRYQNGVMALVEATTEGYRLKGKFQIPGAGGDSWAHPVVANGRLYLREKDTLLVYDVRAREQLTDTRPKQRTWTGTLGRLQQLGVELEPVTAYLERTGSRKHRQLYGELADLADLRQGPVLVTLHSQHLATDGSLQPMVRQLLETVSRPLLVNLAGTGVGPAGVGQLARLKSLRGINLELCPRVDDVAVKQLSRAKGLRVLGLMGVGVTEKGLQSLERLETLQALDLEICEQVSDTGCQALGQMTQLRVLILKKTGFEKLKITDAGLNQLATLQGLEVLNLYGNKISDVGLVQLPKLAGLQSLDLSLTAITDDGLVHLSSLQKLRHLELLYSNGFAGPIITNAGLKSLAGLRALESLSLVGARISDQGLSPLASLKRMNFLQLSNTAVTKQGIVTLKRQLPDCQVIR